VQAPSPERIPLGVPLATHAPAGLTGGTGFGESARLVEVLQTPDCPNHQSLMARLPSERCDTLKLLAAPQIGHDRHTMIQPHSGNH
jgi:hypothetical protein